MTIGRGSAHWSLVGHGMSCFGGAAFAAAIGYYLLDNHRTGVLFRAHRKVLFPVLIAGWILFGVGALLLAEVIP